MSKLFNLKKWLSIADAATRLASAFGEKVTEADVLQLAIDGHLRISVLFNCSVFARRGIVTASEEIRPEPIFHNEIYVGVMGVGIRVTPNRMIFLESKQWALEGLFNLEMYGGGILALEKQRNFLMGLPESNNLDPAGIFVSRGSSIYALQRSNSSGVRDEILESLAMPWHPKGYRPCADLPYGSVISVSTSALIEFEQSCNQESDTEEKPLSTKERNSLLTVIAVLLVLIQSHKPGRDSEAAVITEMLKNYDDKSGISKRNLEQKFAEAKRILGSQ